MKTLGPRRTTPHLNSTILRPLQMKVRLHLGVLKLDPLPSYLYRGGTSFSAEDGEESPQTAIKVQWGITTWRQETKGGNVGSADLAWSPTTFSFGWVTCRWALVPLLMTRLKVCQFASLVGPPIIWCSRGGVWFDDMLLLGLKGMISLHCLPKTCIHKFLQGHVEFSTLLASWV